MTEKLYYSMGEVAEMFDVNPSLLRHWETQFPRLRPHRNRKGNRLYTKQDVELLKRIYHLVKEQGMTLDGARRALRQRASSPVADRDAELLERLQRVRALLEEVREELKEEPSAAESPAPAATRPSELPERSDKKEEVPPKRARPAARREPATDEDPFACYEQTLF